MKGEGKAEAADEWTTTFAQEAQPASLNAQTQVGTASLVARA
jgi:hypothetical protein